jgi:hypothetical protein
MSQAGRRNALRVIYALSAVTYTAYFLWYMLVFGPLFTSEAGIVEPPEFKMMSWVAGFLGYLQLAVPLGILVARPMYCGKLLMILFVFSWPMFWLVYWMWSLQAVPGFSQLWIAGTCSTVLAALAIIQQIVDPTLWRPVKTWFSKDYPPPPRQRAST